VTGVTAIDAFCSLAVGQRLGMFASAGVGKSTLLGMVASRADVDVIVVALVGERGREVNEFVEHILGTTGLARSVVVVATSDESSVMRQTAPYTATTIAEHFRDQGMRVLLVIDSLTRFARALRETGLAAGELPVRQGYTASVYTMLPRLLERAGTNPYGSITGLYTVLTNEQGDIDPLADEVKSLIDGHIVLSSELYALGIAPAIDVSVSISRMFDRLHDETYLNAIREVKRALTRLLKERDLLMLGGTPDEEMKRILAAEKELLDLVKQPRGTGRTIAQTKEMVISVVRKLRQ
jgi:type III secretion protein N (ATPase)